MKLIIVLISYKKWNNERLQACQAQHQIMHLDLLLKNWIEVHDQSGNAEDRYKPSKQVRFKTSMLRLDLCDFSDAYIVVKGTTTVTNPDNNAQGRKLAFKNNAPFFSCILKITKHLLTMLKIQIL